MCNTYSNSFLSFLFNLAKEHHTPPIFIFKPQSKKVFEGDTARLECQISAVPTPRIYWKRNNEMVQYNTDRIRYPINELAIGVLENSNQYLLSQIWTGWFLKPTSWMARSTTLLWHMVNRPMCWRGTMHSVLFWGHRKKTLCPKAALNSSSSSKPVEKLCFRIETCNVFIRPWGYRRALMPPECYRDVNYWWLVTQTQCLRPNSLQCPARIVVGLSQLPSMQTDQFQCLHSFPLQALTHKHLCFSACYMTIPEGFASWSITQTRRMRAGIQYLRSTEQAWPRATPGWRLRVSTTSRCHNHLWNWHRASGLTQQSLGCWEDFCPKIPN